MAPVLDELAKKYSGRAKIVRLNVDENRVIPGEYGISGVPALHFFKGGKLVHHAMGARPREEIERHIQTLL